MGASRSSGTSWIRGEARAIARVPVSSFFIRNGHRKSRAAEKQAQTATTRGVATRLAGPSLLSEHSVIAMHRSRRWAYRASTILIVSLALMVVAADAASAAGCLDEVRSPAQRSHVSRDPPTAPADKAPTAVRPHQLSRSGGASAPPASPDKAVITPPASAHDGL